MATINISFDTMTKKAVFTMDGNPMDNVCYFNGATCYDDPSKFCLSIEMCEKDEESGVNYSERLYSSKNDKTFPSKIEGLFQEPKSIKVNQKIVNALRNRS